MNDIPISYNPYAKRGMIRTPDQFFGRRRELQIVLSRLEQMQSVSIVGERRIGKSSLLYQVCLQARDQPRRMYDCFYLDLEKVFSAEEFFQRSYRLLSGQQETHTAFEQTLEQRETRIAFEHELEQRRVALCLDEFEQTIEYDEEFFKTLRSLAQSGNLALVVATKRPLPELAGDDALTSPFFNIFTALRLGELTADEADELVRAPATRAGHPLTEEEVACVLAITAKSGARRHPYWLNLACEKLYDMKQSGPVDCVAVEQQFEAAFRELQPRPTVAPTIVRERPVVADVPAAAPSSVALRMAGVLMLIGAAFGWFGLQFANPISVFVAAGLIVAAIGLLANDLVRIRRVRRRAP